MLLCMGHHKGRLRFVSSGDHEGRPYIRVSNQSAIVFAAANAIRNSLVPRHSPLAPFLLPL